VNGKVLSVAVIGIAIFAIGCAHEEQSAPPMSYRIEQGPARGPTVIYQQQPGAVAPGTVSTLTNAPGAYSAPHEAAPVQEVQQAPVVQQPQSASPPQQQVVTAGPVQQPAVVVQPPPVRVEVVPGAPGPGYVWVNGYWNWNGAWVWVPGRYVFPPRPHLVWVPGVWIHERHGWRWHHGHWR